jgi:carbamoyl-phosphate synthase large subunit
VIRPSYVLGGRGDGDRPRPPKPFERYIREAVVSRATARCCSTAICPTPSEVDVDALCDGENVHVAGIMEHIEEAGVHSGDSACSLPPHTLTDRSMLRAERQTESAGPGAQCGRPDERAVRHQGRR